MGYVVDESWTSSSLFVLYDAICVAIGDVPLRHSNGLIWRLVVRGRWHEGRAYLFTYFLDEASIGRMEFLVPNVTSSRNFGISC